jgi:hypothetical protein
VIASMKMPAAAPTITRQVGLEPRSDATWNSRTRAIRCAYRRDTGVGVVDEVEAKVARATRTAEPMQRFLVDLERGQVLEQGDTHGVLTQRPASRNKGWTRRPARTTATSRTRRATSRTRRASRTTSRTSSATPPDSEAGYVCQPGVDFRTPLLAEQVHLARLKGHPARIGVDQEGATLVETDTLTAAVLPAHRLSEQRIARAPRGQDLGKRPGQLSAQRRDAPRSRRGPAPPGAPADECGSRLQTVRRS